MRPTHMSTCSLNLSEVRCKKQKLCEHKTDHNSGSWAPLEMKSSSLDRIFHAASTCQRFKAWNLQNKAQKRGDTKKSDTTKSRDRKKIGPGKMKILKSCFDPLERRGIPDLVWVATGDEVWIVLKRWVISEKPFLHMKNFPKIVITRAPDHAQTWFRSQNELFFTGGFF